MYVFNAYGGIVMAWFEILIGISSIGSFIVAVIALVKIRNIEKIISITYDESNKTKQSIKKTKVENGSVVAQVGRDYKG